MTDSSQDPNAQSVEPHKEPSLGPACLVIVILMLATLCIVCAFGSWFMFSDQYPLAEKGIERQLVPWIEQSQLATEDKEQILAKLDSLLPQIRERTLDKQQLTRLHNCLQDNPVLLWGAIDAVVAQASDAGLSETEQESLERVSQRLLRAAAERKLSRNDLEFTIQNLAQVNKEGQSLEVVGSLTGDQIREFMERAESLVERNKIPNEPYDKTPAQAFSALVDAALTLPDSPVPNA